MPLYEYECDACGHRFEVIQKFSDAPVDRCPACGGAVHKMQSAPAFQFKGTGWYVTDYAKKNAPAGKSESSSKQDAPAKSEKKDSSSGTGDSTTSAPAAAPSSTKD